MKITVDIVKGMGFSRNDKIAREAGLEIIEDTSDYKAFSMAIGNNFKETTIVLLFSDKCWKIFTFKNDDITNEEDCVNSVEDIIRYLMQASSYKGYTSGYEEAKKNIGIGMVALALTEKEKQDSY